MGFKVIESDEEFEAALVAGLLWRNISGQWPRPITGWVPCESHEHHITRMRREEARYRKADRRKWAYQPEDFAVLVEDDACD